MIVDYDKLSCKAPAVIQLVNWLRISRRGYIQFISYYLSINRNSIEGMQDGSFHN
jgi:hypothetical protein